MHTEVEGTIKTAPRVVGAEARAIAGVVSAAKEKLGEAAAQELERYFSTDRTDAYKVTGNAGSGSCWINAPEDWYLKNNKAQLAVFIEGLIRDGHMTAQDFVGADEHADATYGARTGASLALDRVCERMMGCPMGANDFIIERFETKLRGEKTISVFNGKSQEGRNGSKDIARIVEDHPEQAKGLRCSIVWLNGPIDSTTGKPSIACHQITIEKIENGRVYFYQPVSVEGIKGPPRIWEGKEGLESMSLRDFKKLARTLFVPQSLADEVGISRSTDPSYYTVVQGSSAIEGSMQKSTVGNPQAVQWITPELLMNALYHGALANTKEAKRKQEEDSRKSEEKGQMPGYVYRDILAGKGE